MESPSSARSLANLILQVEQLAQDVQNHIVAPVVASFILGRLYERAALGPLSEDSPLSDNAWWDSDKKEVVLESGPEPDNLLPLDHAFYEAVSKVKQACGWPSTRPKDDG